MKKVLLIVAVMATSLMSAQDMMMEDTMMDKGMDKMMSMIDHGKLHLMNTDALITLGTTGKAAAFVRECLEAGVDAELGFTPSPFRTGRIAYTDLSPVKLLNMEEAKAMAGVNGFAPETANVILDGVNYTIRMVGPVVHKDNFVVQGNGWAARYDLGVSEGTNKITLVKKIKISKMNMR